MADTYLPLAAMGKLLKENSSLRISKGAQEALRDAVEARCREIGKLAKRFAAHAGRQTIQEEDVELALEQMK